AATVRNNGNTDASPRYWNFSWISADVLGFPEDTSTDSGMVMYDQCPFSICCALAFIMSGGGELGWAPQAGGQSLCTSNRDGSPPTQP
ncbi:ALK tyrosine kinase receptor, partial [Tachysurus ichikawai]